ncbi:MAG: hypothetical protein JRJ11_13635, partial [Deltaproteobacteria bacterium]|nr:hypothetical protein [Deltaproteobacteria bacterium]
EELTPQEEKELDAHLRAKWDGMKKALKQNDPDKAAEYFHPSTKERYRKIFKELSKPSKKRSSSRQ